MVNKVMENDLRRWVRLVEAGGYAKQLMMENHWGATPAGRFLDHYLAWEKPHRLEKKGFIVDLQKEADDLVYLDMLWVPQKYRGQRWGNAIMHAICAAADQADIRLRCEPAWQDEQVEPEFNLRSFYDKFGFEFADRAYIRAPQSGNIKPVTPLRKTRAVPRPKTVKPKPPSVSQQREELLQLAIQRHPDRPSLAIQQQIDQLDEDQLASMLDRYRGYQ
jgi:ribosomal protein S18 acetylase RimI-like enzyme